MMSKYLLVPSDSLLQAFILVKLMRQVRYMIITHISRIIPIWVL